MSQDVINPASASFNPCFRGTCSWCLIEERRADEEVEVSILVFVELALDVYRIRMKSFRSTSFNPCFRGTCSWCVAQPLPYKVIRSFNPCFRGTCSWWVNGAREATAPAGFNPCFRGTCSWWRSDSRQDYRRIVSILVFVELALDAYRHYGCRLEFVVSILVFVELALDGRGSRMRNLPRFGFNPCFRGTCSWCLVSSHNWRRRKQFQSLFSWNLLLMPATEYTAFPKLIVSILVFVELALDADPPYELAFMGKFQSLFSWNLLLMVCPP